MSQQQESPLPYTESLKRQFDYLNSTTILLWLGGILFTRLATDTWFGERPVLVVLVLFFLVYLYMHLGYSLTMLIRIPVALLIVYLGHTHLIQPGDFLLSNPIVLSWRHLILAWTAMNFSLAFRSEEYPLKFGTVLKAPLVANTAMSNERESHPPSNIVSFTPRNVNQQ